MDKQQILDGRYMRMAAIWAENSYCKRRQVGALVVKDNRIISDGYNGTPSGFENVCEDDSNVTYPYVLHADLPVVIIIVIMLHSMSRIPHVLSVLSSSFRQVSSVWCMVVTIVFLTVSNSFAGLVLKS